MLKRKKDIYLKELKAIAKLRNNPDLLNVRNSINNINKNGKSLISLSNPYKNPSSDDLHKTRYEILIYYNDSIEINLKVLIT